MPFPAAPYTPTKLDPTNKGMAAAGFQLWRSTPYKNGANWFFVLYDDTNSLFEVLKSTDDQLTWTVAKTITSVTTVTFRTFSDGTKIYVAYDDNGNTGKVTFFDYNMSSNVLTGPYGATGAPAQTILGFYVRPSDGKYVVIAVVGSPAKPSWYVYNPTGATWSGPNDASTNVTHVTSFGANLFYVIEDPNTSIGHTFFIYKNSLDATNHLVYQRINANDTLGTFNDFGTGTLNGNAVSGNAISNTSDPILDFTNNMVVISIYDTVSTGKWVLIFGASLGAGVWSASLIDTFQWFTDAPLVQILGSNYTACAMDDNLTPFDKIYYYTTTVASGPSAGWSARTTIFSGASVSGAWTTGGLRHATIGTQASGLFLYFGSVDPTNTFHLEYSLGSTAIANYHLRVLQSANLSPASNNDVDWTLGGVQL